MEKSINIQLYHTGHEVYIRRNQKIRRYNLPRGSQRFSRIWKLQELLIIDSNWFMASQSMAHRCVKNYKE